MLHSLRLLEPAWYLIMTSRQQIQVKAHQGDEIRKIMVPTGVDYEDFIGRLREKFGFRRNVRCKMRDEDGDGMITISDQEDLDLAISSSKKEARKLGVEYGKMEVCSTFPSGVWGLEIW